MRANLLSLNTGSHWQGFNNLLLIVGVLTTLVYFFFSLEHKGGGRSRLEDRDLLLDDLLRRLVRIYGNGANSLLIGRMEFLFREWPAAFGIHILS
ncbi:MAG: hypothetical protein R3E12_17530 [Candidatus Eisenbacteria bacterium]